MVVKSLPVWNNMCLLLLLHKLENEGKWTDVQKTKQNKNKSAGQGGCGETWPAGVIVGSYAEAWMNQRLEKFIPSPGLTSLPQNSYPQSFGWLLFVFLQPSAFFSFNFSSQFLSRCPLSSFSARFHFMWLTLTPTKKMIRTINKT